MSVTIRIQGTTHMGDCSNMDCEEHFFDYDFKDTINIDLKEPFINDQKLIKNFEYTKTTCICGCVETCQIIRINIYPQNN